MKILQVLIISWFSFQSFAADNLVLVTIDGLRWQEVFTGADPQLIDNKDFVQHPATLKQQYWHTDPTQRRALLMPFLWQTVIKQGRIIGNRQNNSQMRVSNDMYFSYPGYSEIFTGVADPSIDSNKKFNNPQVTFLEWLSAQKTAYKTNALFGSWDVFPFIVNQQRSKLHVNAGFQAAEGYAVSEHGQWLNNLQQQIPSPWHNVRLDAFTQGFALDYLKQVQPRVMIIAYGETDDFAHGGHYDQYLSSAHRTDKFIADLWQQLQSMPQYKNNTTLLITTDHGRGSNSDDWQHHASKKASNGYLQQTNRFPEGILGSEHIWLAAIGPDISPKGEVATGKEVLQKQIAATALSLLGEDYKKFNPAAGKPIMEIIQP
ncbi:alkaline phosphatase family protein [Alteromonadaceae bacterium BrNp21-10]|nr:alkaline phosphatase family protein [Alteromonadaceae bacterium BrNp21-10]